MIVRTSKKEKRFVGCTGFPNCKNTYSLPQKGEIITTDKACNTCGAPIIKVIMKGKKAWEPCLNLNCPTNKK